MDDAVRGTSGFLRYAERDGTAFITLDRPEKLNALDTAFYGDLKAAILQTYDADVDIVVLRSSGRAFSTGGDLSEVRALLDAGRGLGDFFAKLPFTELYDCPKTTVAVVPGPCVAGGLEIALLCDVIVAGRSATFGFSQARVGLADTSAPALLLGRVPLTQAQYLLYTGATIDAATAARIGLVTEVVDDDRLQARTDELLGELRQTSPAVRAEYKAMLRQLAPFPEHRTVPFPDSLEHLQRFFDRHDTKSPNPGP